MEKNHSERWSAEIALDREKARAQSISLLLEIVNETHERGENTPRCLPAHPHIHMTNGQEILSLELN